MKIIEINIDYNKWDDIRIVKTVNKAGQYKCNIEILRNRDYINVKSVTSMMSFFEEKKPADNLKLHLDGMDEEKASVNMCKYLND